MSCVEEIVRSILAGTLNIGDREVLLESSIIDDLGADSLDCVELIMECEEEFNIEIPDEEAEQLTTVEKLIRYIETGETPTKNMGGNFY